MHENGQGRMHDDREVQKPVLDGSLIKSSHDERKKMFIGGLSWETDEAKLKTHFDQFGEVMDVVVKRDPNNNRSRGFGFILFKEDNCVEKVLAHSQHLLDGRAIDPKPAKAQKKDTKLFVGGLNPDTEDDKIVEHFKKWGEIENLERPKDRVTGKRRGFCFITFEKDGVIQEVIKHGQFHRIDGRDCECKDGVDPKKQAGRGRNQGQDNYVNFGPPGGFNPWQQQQWFGGYPGGYDYSSGYGSYGNYGSGYGGYGGYGSYGSYGGYGGYGSGYGGYGGDYNPNSMPGGGMQQQQQQQQQQNSGGKAKTAGRGAQNNYKPY